MRGAFSADGNESGLAETPAEVADLRERVTAFVEHTVEDADAERAVVALDGGLESTVLAALATDALGTDRVEALVMPAHLSSEAAARDAETVAGALGLEPNRVHLGALLAAFREAVGAAGAPADDLLAMQNALARLRMACAYYVANTGSGVVLGSATRTERLVGSVTKHGTVGADALPLGDCYATEVRALADALGVPDAVVDSDAGFDITPSDAAELGIDDRTLDELLVALVDSELGPEAAAERVGVTPETATRVAEWHAATAHKRRVPPTPGDE